MDAAIASGSVGIAGLVAFFTALKVGTIATRQEVDAWKGRAERAEKQVDTLLPALRELTEATRDRPQLGVVP